MPVYVDDTVPPIPDDVPLKVYLDYAFERVRRSANIIATMTEAAAERMKPGHQIVVMTGVLFHLGMYGHEHWIDPVIFRDPRLQLSETWRRQVR